MKNNRRKTVNIINSIIVLLNTISAIALPFSAIGMIITMMETGSADKVPSIVFMASVAWLGIVLAYKIKINK